MAIKLISVDGYLGPSRALWIGSKETLVNRRKPYVCWNTLTTLSFRLSTVFTRHQSTCSSQNWALIPLSDKRDLSIGKASLCASNVEATASIPLSSGINVYDHADSGKFSFAILEFLLKSFVKPSTTLPNWIPGDFDPLQILSQIDVGNSDSTLAMHVGESKIRFFVRIPLLNSLLYYIELTFGVRLDRADVKYSPRTGLGFGGVIQILFENGRAVWNKLVDFVSEIGEKIYDEMFEPVLDGVGNIFEGVSVESAKAQAQEGCERIFGTCGRFKTKVTL